MKRMLTRVVAVMFTLILASTLTFAAEKKVIPAMPAIAKNAAPAATLELLDINTATEVQLKAIPGIGETYSKKIIAGRPFTNKSQLLSKKIIPKPVYDKIKDKIIAKQPKKKKEAAGC